MRLTVAAAVSCALLTSVMADEYASAAITQFTQIPAEGLGVALEDLARERKLQLIYVTADVGNRHSDGALGNLSTADALKQLLKGTGLSYQFLDAKTVTVQPAVGSFGTGSDDHSDPALNNARLQDLRLAQTSAVTQGNAVSTENLQAASAPGSSNDESASRLDEIIVTAQKKSERLQDVPIPVTVLNADQLTEFNHLMLRDYATTVPGFSVAPNSFGSQVLAIRGITTGDLTTPTVGVMIDDVPFGGATDTGVPDIDPGDLARVEVLRGPQGTLYGTNSMGGLLKYVTLDPSTVALSGRIQAGVDGVQHGDQAGYNVRASINVPLSDTWAIRASGFAREEPGYIDNPIYGLRGVNESKAEGARLSALWLPAEDFSLKLSALYQHTRTYALDEVEVAPGLGVLQQGYLPGSGGDERTLQAYSATANLKLGTAELTSVTGYNVNDDINRLDYGFAFGGPGGFIDTAFPGATGAPYFNVSSIRKVTQEFRLSIPLGQHFDWLIGTFYTHESTQASIDIDAENTSTGQLVGDYYHFSSLQPSTFQSYAAFTDLTYHVTDRFDVQVGGRESHDRLFTAATITSGQGAIDALGETNPTFLPALESSATAFTYLVTPQFKISPDLMLYARFASGYRPGTGNNPIPGIPRQSNPDKTENYEFGLKGDFWGHALALDASLYYIDWKDIQLTFLYNQELPYTSNGGRAKSQGVELSATLKPLTGLTLTGWIAYDDAVLKEDFSAISTAYGARGDRLPGSSRFSGSFSVQQDFPLWASTKGYVGGALSYVGDRLGIFTGSPGMAAPRQDYPAYAKMDLRTGVQYDSWTLNLYLNNVTDRRGLLDGGIGYFPATAFIYIQPRTLGLNVSRAF